jgi:hypothetical protein
MARRPVDLDRLFLGRHAVFSLSRAAQLYPGGDSRNRARFRRWGIVYFVDGTAVVRWSDILDKTAQADAATDSDGAPSVVALPRVKLIPL